MDSAQRDSTQEWMLSAEATPPRLDELVARIDEALEAASASKAVAIAVGDAAMEAAEQARAAVQQALRAAEHAQRSALLAERASASMLEKRRPRPAPGAAPDDDRSMRSFSERADRVVARLRALERLPV